MGSKYVKFKHKVDKDAIPKCNIMGVDFAITDMDKFLKDTVEMVKDKLTFSERVTTLVKYAL